MNTPKDQMSDLLLNLQYLMTSGADHLTGNLEHWELVYLSSSTNLRSKNWLISTLKWAGWVGAIGWGLSSRYIQRTLTWSYQNQTPSPRYFLKRDSFWQPADTEEDYWVGTEEQNGGCNPPSARLPDLCGGSWSSPGRPSPRWRPCTCSATSPETKCLSWPAGSRRGSHSPWTRTPGTGGNAGCSQRRVEPACGVTASCQMQKCAELSHRPNAIGTSCEMPLHHNPGLLLQIVFRHAPFSDHFHRHLLRLPPTFQHEPELTAAYLLTQGQFIGVQLPLICSTEARWWTDVAKQLKHQIHSEPSNLQREQKLAGHHFHLEIQGVSSGLSDLSGR